jgi:uncharacterized membrane protein (DUF485 family)
MDARVASLTREHTPPCAVIDWSGAAKNRQFQHLTDYKRHRVRPAIAIYFLSYISVSVLAGFAPGLMSIKLMGAFSLGYALILSNYFMAWAVALWYVHAARTEFDPLQQQAIQSMKDEGSIR